jgi:DNA topoisomerase-1
MKSGLKSLRHNGVYVPAYEYKGLLIKIRGNPVKLSPKTEQMASAWMRKIQSATSPPDKVFYKNFIKDFLEQLKLENHYSNFLNDFSIEHLNKIDADDFELVNSCNDTNRMTEIDFSQISEYLTQEKLKKLNNTKSEREKLAKQKKVQRETLKRKFGYAFVNGRKIDIANWSAEPSCIFVGRGNHPKRGKWKNGPQEEDISLNLSPETPKPPGKWADIVWEPTKMYIAKWQDKLAGKIKYVWFSDSAFIKQTREREKFNKAKKLGRLILDVEAHILKNLDSKNSERRKIATACWLILAINMRVGDEKDSEEADTVGAITLRPEHIKVESETLHFDFLGKDSVRWVRSIEAPKIIIENIDHYSKICEEYLFEGIDSKKASKFLSEKIKGLTAKVFRTWKTTKTVKEYLEKCEVKKDSPEYVKRFYAKMANLKGAEVANHKRKIPSNFDEKIAKKEVTLKELELTLEEKKTQGKKIDAILTRIEKTKLDIDLMRETKEYNLGTSLKSYIDPKVYMEWASKIDFSLDKLYPPALRKKYSWALKKLP